MGSTTDIPVVNDSTVDDQDQQSSRQSSAALTCPLCGKAMLFRTSRQGFLQRVIFARFGYYPWKCGACKKVQLLNKRGVRRSRSSGG
jgi:hypothetical protein